MLFDESNETNVIPNMSDIVNEIKSYKLIRFET